jgi:hypothetical protein
MSAGQLELWEAAKAMVKENGEPSGEIPAYGRLYRAVCALLPVTRYRITDRAGQVTSIEAVDLVAEKGTTPDA